MARFRKNEQFENLGHLHPQLERIFGYKSTSRQSKVTYSLNNDVRKRCESLRKFGVSDGRGAENLFQGGGRRRAKVFIVPVVVITVVFLAENVT